MFHLVSFFDLFGEGVETLEDRGDYYLQGKSITSYFSEQPLRSADAFIVFAISSMSHAELLRIVSQLKQEFKKPVFILENSQAVTAYAVEKKAGDYFSAGADGLICGEPYWNWDAIKEFILDPGSAPPMNVLSPKNAGAAPIRQTNKNPTYPVPAWDLVPYKNYWSLPYSHGPKTKTYFPIFTSRGCPYPCDFCVVPATNQRLWRGRPAEDVVGEMLALKKQYGVSDFQIEDLNPTISKERTADICRALLKENAQVRFYLVSGTKAETVPLDQVKLMAEAGCRYISISPESGSKKVMKEIGKPFDYEHGARLVSECHKHGIATQACFVVGHPKETKEDHLESVKYLKTLVRAGLDETAIFILAPLPGSDLAEHQEIAVSSLEKLVSFSPKGRVGWVDLAKKRRQLIRVFFEEKSLRFVDSVGSAVRALFCRPRTKMENLPWRVVFVYKTILINRLKSLF